MERAFRTDFSRVRLHADAPAMESAAAIAARAYSAGPHVVLGRSATARGVAGVRESLAHELAHVARHGSDRIAPGSLSLAGRHDPEEREAAASARAVSAAHTPVLQRATTPTAGSAVIRCQPEPGDKPMTPLPSGSWASSSASINLTPPNVPRDPSAPGNREPVWCQYGGEDRGDECKPLHACRTSGSSTFVFHAIYRVDSPPPAPAYPAAYHDQPIEVAGDFHFEPASGGQQPIGAFSETVRYAGHGRPVHTHKISFSTRENGVLVYLLTVKMPTENVLYNGSSECTLINCV
jgi:hypothetical protein